MFIYLLLLYIANNTEQVILWLWPCLYTWQSWIEIPFEHITEFDALTSAKVGEVVSRDQLKVSQETTSRWDFVDAHMCFAVCMSSALNGSSVLQRLNVVMRSKYANGIWFDFYLWLPHITSADPPGSMFVMKNICRLWINMVIPTCLHCVQVSTWWETINQWIGVLLCTCEHTDDLFLVPTVSRLLALHWVQYIKPNLLRDLHTCDSLM